MQRHHLTWLIYTLLGFFLAIIVSAFLFAAAVGALWLFVYGDNPWPAFVNGILISLAAATFLGVWLAVSIAGYRIGKSRNRRELSRKDMLLPLLALIFTIGLIALHQFAVGNIGPVSEGMLCSQFCSKKGYAGSGMPPRVSGESTCSCYDSLGREVIKLPISDIDPETRE